MSSESWFETSEAQVRRLLADVWASPSERLPTLEKCSGRGKFLGEWFVPGLLEWMNRALPSTTVQDLVLLTTLLRTSVVVRDHLDDEWLAPSARDCLADALVTVEREAETRLRDVGRSALSVWRAARRISRLAFRDFDAIGYADAIAGKNIVAHVPIHLVASLTGAEKTRRDSAARFVRDYLWALQIVDDWQDRRYDETNRVNHNLFDERRFSAVMADLATTDRLTSEVYRRVETALLRYRSVRSDVVRSFIINGLRHLHRARPDRDGELTIDRFHARCELI